MPNSICDYSSGEWIITVHQVLCIFQSSDGGFGVGGFIERFERSRYGFARFLVVSPHKEHLIKGFVVENPRSETRGYGVSFQAPILNCEFRELRHIFY